MRMRQIKISEVGILEIDVMELPISCVLIISEGNAKLAELPPYAETKIFTHGGKVKRVKWEEGEEF